MTTNNYYIDQVLNLERQLIGNIKTLVDNKRLGEDDEIEFNNPFILYVTEENTYDDSSVKSSFIVKGMKDGYRLIGEHLGSEMELSVDLVESVFEIAYIADVLQSELFTINIF